MPLVHFLGVKHPHESCFFVTQKSQAYILNH